MRIYADNTNGSSMMYKTFLINANNIKNLKTNLTYTLMCEIRNLNRTNNTAYYDVNYNFSTAKTAILNPSIWSINSSGLSNGIFKKSFTARVYTERTCDIRASLNVPAGEKCSMEVRYTIVEGDYTNKPLQWTKYRDSSITFPLSEPLRAEGSMDLIDFKNKKIVRNVRKTVLDGNSTYEYWALAIVTTDTNCVSFYIGNTNVRFPNTKIPSTSSIKMNMKCDKFKIVDRRSAGTIIGENCGISNSGAFWITILKSRLTGWSNSLTVEQKIALFRTFLASNNLFFEYESTNPVETPFTAEQLAVADLYTTQDYCQIYCDNETPPLQIDIDYLELGVE